MLDEILNHTHGIGVNGSVSPLYEPAILLKQVGVIPGYDLTSEAALAKLSYLLSLPDMPTEEITRLMSLPLRGEHTVHTGMEFQHPDGFLPQHLSDLTKLVYAISRGNVSEVEGLLRGDVAWLLNEPDYSGNTPLVSWFSLSCSCPNKHQHTAATGPDLEILKALLLKGASVHLRNKRGRTPLFLAAESGLAEHVSLLRDSGAHLHADELGDAKLYSPSDPVIWRAAGL